VAQFADGDRDGDELLLDLAVIITLVEHEKRERKKITRRVLVEPS